MRRTSPVMGMATLVLVASLMATSTLADIGYDSRLSPVELAIIKSIVDTVPESGISSGNPYNWAALQTRSRALEGANVQVVQVQDRSPDFSGRSGRYPDDASIIQAVSTQLGNLEGSPLQQGGGPHGLNIKKSVSAELHLNAQVLPDLPAKEPTLKQVSYNYQEPAFNSPPISAPSGAHTSAGGGESFSFHRSIASELNAAMFGDFPAQQPAPQQQAPVLNNYPQSFSQFQTQQHFHQQQLPNFNNQQQFSSVSGNQALGGGFNDFNSQQHSSVSGSQVSAGGYNDFNNQQQYSSLSGSQVLGGSFNSQQHSSVPGSQVSGEGYNDFSNQQQYSSLSGSHVLGGFNGFNNQQQASVSGSQLSGGGYNNFNKHQQYSTVSGSQVLGGGFNDFSIHRSVPYDLPSDTVVPPRPPLAQGRVDVGHPNQFIQDYNKEVTGTNNQGGSLSEFSIQKSIDSEIASDTFKMPGEDQEPLLHSIDIRISGNKETVPSSSGTQNSEGGIGFSNQQLISNDIPTDLFTPPTQDFKQWNQNQGSGGVSDVSVQKSIASEISTGGAQSDDSHSEGFVKHVQEQTSFAKQVNQAAYDAALNSGHDASHEVNADGPVQEKADFVEVNIMQTVSSSDEGTSSGSHESSAENGEGSSSVENSEENNNVHVQDTAIEHHSSESGSSEEVDVHTPERVETPPLEADLPCKEGERRIKSVCRKVYSLQLKAHLRKK